MLNSIADIEPHETRLNIGVLNAAGGSHAGNRHLGLQARRPAKFYKI